MHTECVGAGQTAAVPVERVSKTTNVPTWTLLAAVTAHAARRGRIGTLVPCKGHHQGQGI